MPSKFQIYRQMAEEAARQVTGSYNGWTGFLTIETGTQQAKRICYKFSLIK